MEQVRAEQEAWGADPGADLVPKPGGPHTYGGDLWRTPACRGCGHPIRAWFTLDLTAIPRLEAILPGWRWLPLLSCVDCMVWMGRHDYAIDPLERTVDLLAVDIDTEEYGTAYDTTPAIPPQPAELVWRAPLTGDAIVESDHEGPQVGGAPSWVQDSERPGCPACGKEMAFVAAMGRPEGFSPEIPVNNESGFQYHFACAACRRLAVIAQWT